jgi:hypothetical protein
MEYPHVFLGRNAFFEVDQMETKDYLQFFQPFGIKEGQPSDSAIITGKALEYTILFSRNYAEPTDWLFGIFSELYTHFTACIACRTAKDPATQAYHAALVSGFREYGLGFRMVMDGKPTLVWEFNSLKTALETLYGFMVSDADQPLRICKHCGTVFFATHGRLAFCGGRCRNRFNVYKSRGK